jgi:membrane dipeptidase
MLKRILLAALVLVAGAMLACAQAKEEARAPEAEDALWQRALKIHREAIVADTHADTPSLILDEGFDIGPRSTRSHVDIPRLKEGGVTAEFFAVYVSKSFVAGNASAHRALAMIDAVRHDIIERYPDDFLLATSVADIRRAKAQGKIAALMGIEGGHAIEDSLRLLRSFHALGVRYLTLTHSNTNNWADSSGDAPRHNGLNDLGRQVVAEMNRIGMMVDISHVADKTFYDVIAVTKAPVIASHSSARALANHPRNLTDDMLRAVAKNGGVVMVNFYPTFLDQAVIDAEKNLDPQVKAQRAELEAKYAKDWAKLSAELRKLHERHPLPRATLATLIRHIDHIAKTAGVDHVGLGSDFDGIDTVPVGMEDVSKLPHITYELLKLGYSEGDIRKILGENLLRVFGEAERVSREMKAGKP